MLGNLKYLAAPALAVYAIGAPTQASAAVVVLTTSITVWTGNNPSPGDPNNSTQQALPTNALTSQAAVGTYSYTGPINFANLSQSSDFMDTWIAGIGLPHLQMSSPTFVSSSLFKFTFTVASTLQSVSLTHDDGVSLFDAAAPATNLLPGSSSGPTSVVTTSVPNLVAGHTYNLWYVASNGAPSILQMSAVPEPSSWMLLIVGFGAVGFASRRARGTVRFTKQMA